MDIVCLEGAAPGIMTASIAHDGVIRRLTVELARHAQGGWQARLPQGRWGLRCNEAATAILLEAAELFTGASIADADAASAILPHATHLAAAD